MGGEEEEKFKVIKTDSKKRDISVVKGIKLALVQAATLTKLYPKWSS